MEPEIKYIIENYIIKISQLSSMKIDKDVLFLLAHAFENIATVSYNIGKVHELNDFLILQAKSPSSFNN